MIKEVAKNELQMCLHIIHKMRLLDDGECGIQYIVVLPEYRCNGYGLVLLNFSKCYAHKLGSNTIRLGMIDDNTRLRTWYKFNGFYNIGCKRYEGLPYTVGRTECRI